MPVGRGPDYSRDFMEEAVFTAVTFKERQGVEKMITERFHQEREQVYSGEQVGREEAFAGVYEKYFSQLGLKSFFEDFHRQYASFPKNNICSFIRPARSRKSEGVELYVRSNAKTMVTSLQIDWVCDLTFLGAYLRHEWQRVDDMLNPEFRYDACASLEADHEIEENLNRDRYRILWDLNIAVRLENQSKASYLSRNGLESQFRRAFLGWREDECKRILYAVCSSGLRTQQELIQWASVKRRRFYSGGQAPQQCPLCSFTSYGLVTMGEKKWENVQALIRASYPAWNPDDGVCPQCAELFRSRVCEGAGCDR